MSDKKCLRCGIYVPRRETSPVYFQLNINAYVHVHCICIPSFIIAHHIYVVSVTFAMCIFRVSNRKPEDKTKTNR